MNGKERVMAALKLQMTDTIPYGEYAVDSDTVEKIIGHETYLRAKGKCQIAFWEGRRDEVVQSWKEDMVELNRRIDCFDIVNLAGEASGIVPPRGYTPEAPKRIDAKTWEDASGNIYKYSEITKDITKVYSPGTLEMEYTVEEFEGDAVIPEPDESIFEVVDHIIKNLGDEKFVIGSCGREAAFVLLGGFESGLMQYAINPEAVTAATKREVRIGIQEDRYYIRPGTDGIMWGQDFAYNTGPMISPALFREIVLPAAKQRMESVKMNFGLPVIKHACGNNWPLMDMFIESGYDCYQSIQGSATMDIKRLQERYGDRICLWGGIPVETVIGGTPAEIRRSIRDTVHHFDGRDGLILGSSHSIAVGSDYDNFMTIIDEVQKLR